MTKEELNTVKIIKHHTELQKALQLKAKYESLLATDPFWINFQQKEYLRLQKHLADTLPANLMVEENTQSKVDFKLLYDLCYVDVFNQANGMNNSTTAYQKLAELVESKKYLCFDISGIRRRSGGAPKWNYLIKAYRYTGDVNWFRDGYIIDLNSTIKTKKSAISLLSKKLTKPLNLVLEKLPFNPIIPPELKAELPFPKLPKIEWPKHTVGAVSEADMESSLLLNPDSWGLSGWYPVAQQFSLTQNGRVDAVLGNDSGQLLLVELQRGNLSKDHYSKITVYRRQLAKDWGVDPKIIGMVIVANECNDVLRECCEDSNIQLIIKPIGEARKIVSISRPLWETSEHNKS